MVDTMLHRGAVMLKILEPFLKKKNPLTPADLQAAIGEVDAQERATANTVDDLRGQYKHALVNGDDHRKLDEIEESIKVANRKLEQLFLAREELRELLTKAEETARANEANEIYAAAVAAKSQGLDLIGGYASAASQLVDVLNRLEMTEAQIASANIQLSHRGDGRRIQSIEESYWSARETWKQHPPWSILKMCRLPDPEVCRKLLWPRSDQT